jgi:hypothetical protein
MNDYRTKKKIENNLTISMYYMLLNVYINYVKYNLFQNSYYFSRGSH